MLRSVTKVVEIMLISIGLIKLISEKYIKNSKFVRIETELLEDLELKKEL